MDSSQLSVLLLNSCLIVQFSSKQVDKIMKWLCIWLFITDMLIKKKKIKSHVLYSYIRIFDSVFCNLLSCRDIWKGKNSNFLQVFGTLKSKELALTSIKNKTKVLFQNNHTEIPYIKRNVCAWQCSMSKV